MKDDAVVFTEEELDFFKEMMNIGAGNAATALEQMLGLKTDMKIPLVKRFRKKDSDELVRDIRDPFQPVTAVCMNLIGQVTGKIVFVVPEKDLVHLITLMEKATTDKKKSGTGIDLSVVAEIGNIIAGMYLGAIHDFCLLNIYHSIPKIKTGLVQDLYRELLPKNDHEMPVIIFVINEFITESGRITSYVILAPDTGSMEIIAQSLRQAKDKLSLP